MDKELKLILAAEFKATDIKPGSYCWDENDGNSI